MKNFEILPFVGYVITKNLPRGAKHGGSERQRKYFQSQGHVAEKLDDRRTTTVASLCQKLGGLKNKLFSMTNLHRKTPPTIKCGYSS